MKLENLSKEELIQLRNEIDKRLGEQPVIVLQKVDLINKGYLFEFETEDEQFITIADKLKSSLSDVSKEDIDIVCGDRLRSIEWLIDETDGTELNDISLIVGNIMETLILNHNPISFCLSEIEEGLEILTNFEYDGSSFSKSDIKTMMGYFNQLERFAKMN